jgi:hypothetical protein
VEQNILLAFAVAATTLIGWPIAYVILPERLSGAALSIAPTVGFAFIIFVSYFCYRLNLGPANEYAWLVAAALLGLLAWLAVTGRMVVRGTDWTAIAAYLFALLIVNQFYLIPGGRAVAFSLGNLDIAELATEARFLQEFSRDSTIGYLGQDGALRARIDTLWAGPALFCAFLSALLGSAPYKLQSIALCVVAAQGATFVWLIAREGLRLQAEAGHGAAMLYAVNPVSAYTLWMAFGAQATSIPLLLAGILFFMVAMQATHWRENFRYAPALILMMTALLTNYHFMLLIVCFLLGTYLLTLSMARRSLETLFVGAALLASSALLAVLINPIRSLALIQNWRDLLPRGGWFIPWLSPDVQLGPNAARVLFNQPAIGPIQNLTSALFVLAVALLLYRLWRDRNREHIAFVFGLGAVALAGGLAVAFVGAESDHLAGYRSFKITGTFAAVTLLTLAIAFSRLDTRSLRVFGGASFVFILAGSVISDISLLARGRGGYVMPDDFPSIQSLEKLPIVGVNFADAGNFDLFWAHYFTLRKKQEFVRVPYGRVIGASQSYTVRPQYDDPSSAPDILFVDAKKGLARPLNSRFELVPNQMLRLEIGDGWWPKEPTHRWTSNKLSTIKITNLGPPVHVRLTGRYEFLRPDDTIGVRASGESVQTVTMRDGKMETATFHIPRGESVIALLAKLDPIRLSPQDPRSMGVMWRELHVEPD